MTSAATAPSLQPSSFAAGAAGAPQPAGQEQQAGPPKQHAAGGAQSGGEQQEGKEEEEFECASCFEDKPAKDHAGAAGLSELLGQIRSRLGSFASVLPTPYPTF